MTVRKLISELKKFPPNAEVGIQDHDSSDNELSGIARCVLPFDYTEQDREFKNFGTKVRVVIRA